MGGVIRSLRRRKGKMTAVCSSIFDTVSVEVTLNVLFEYFSETGAG